jgi:glycosyltransferase involved in cell wall biosynthesis
MEHLLDGRTVAVVHEWLSPVGGSEDVFRAIGDLIPHAQKYVLWAEPGAEAGPVRETWLARTPLRGSKALALPLMPLVWRTSGRPGPDVVISSSHAFAHTVKLGDPGRTRHLSYVHSPARYVWSPDYDSRGAGRALAVPRRALRWVDRRGGRHVHAYVANSAEVRDRIRRFWGRDAAVVHPPVDVEFFGEDVDATKPPARDYLLGAGRWVAYKKFDLIIDIAARAGLPLVLAGSGPEEQALRRRAAGFGLHVTFEVRPGRERLRELYQGARALLSPAHEDFGIVAVEAQAAGTPVIGLGRGGLRETVVHGETGYLVDSDDPADYDRYIRLAPLLDREGIRLHASGFSRAVFAERMTGWVLDVTG